MLEILPKLWLLCKACSSVLTKNKPEGHLIWLTFELNRKPITQ